LFFSQQSAEKYLKALLEELGRHIPRTHILGDLLALLLPHYSSLGSFKRGLKFLTRFAVDIRYPGGWASKRQAVAAKRWAGKVRDACRSILGLPPARRPSAGAVHRSRQRFTDIPRAMQSHRRGINRGQTGMIFLTLLLAGPVLTAVTWTASAVPSPLLSRANTAICW
jgi:hypothetical protein